MGLVGLAAVATEQDVDDAIRSAKVASPAWSRLKYGERAAVLSEDQEDIARRSRLFTREHGKIARDTIIELPRLRMLFEQPTYLG